MRKKILMVAAVAAIALPMAAEAQVTGAISATASVNTVLNFGSSQALDFGSITPGSAATARGWIQLNRNVGVTITLPDAANTGRLTRAGGSETLVPAYACGFAASGGGAIATAFSSCTPASGTEVVGTRAAPTQSVTDYIVFDGSLTAAQTNTIPGTYNGIIRITATQN